MGARDSWKPPNFTTPTEDCFMGEIAPDGTEHPAMPLDCSIASGAFKHPLA